MRRAPIVLTATVLGTAGVLLFKPLSTTSIASAPPSAGDASSTTSPGSDSSTSSTPSGSASAPSRSSSSGKDGTYTGAAETTRFGTTQVKATISGGRITGITAVQLNRADPRSYQISVGAAPTLRSEALAKQTAAVDAVSGATYTSAAYEASLQSALDRAGYSAPGGTKASTDMSNIREESAPGTDRASTR